MRKNYKLSSLKLEDIQPNTPYALSINIKYPKQPLSSTYTTYNTFINTNIKPHCSYLYYVYEQSPIGHTHIHGTVMFTDAKAIFAYNKKIQYYSNRVAFELDTIKDPKIWYDYLHKQIAYHECFRYYGIEPIIEYTKQSPPLTIVDILSA